MRAWLLFFNKNDDKKEQVFVMQLAHPAYDADTKTMQYEIQLVSKNGQVLLNQQPVYDVALFIDNCCPWCG